MRKSIRIGAAVLVLLFACSGLLMAGGQKEPTQKKELTFAYVMPWAVTWYAYLGDAFEYAAKQYGVKTMRAISEYNQNKEIAAIEDFVVKAPDMIGLGSVSGDSAQLAAQKCNAAKIPLVIENSALAAGPGTVAADLEFDWKGLGRMMAEVTAKNWPKARVFVVTGVIGTGPIDMLLDTFQTRAKELGLTIVGIQNGEYKQETALKITQDLIQSGRDFDVIWGNDAGMGQGIIQGIKEAGLLGKKVILTTNGSPMCLASIEKGELNGTINYSPGFHGLLYFLTMYEQATKGKVAPLIYLPMKYITKSNLKDAMLWEATSPDQLKMAEEYFAQQAKK
jgi:ABC-type sugar transport system substrate-binding protein